MRVLDFAVVVIIGALVISFVYAEGGGGVHISVNEKGEIEIVEGAKYGRPTKNPCDGRENCFIVIMTENDTQPKAFSGKDGGYRTGKITMAENDTRPKAASGKDGGYGTGKKPKIVSDRIDPFVNFLGLNIMPTLKIK